MKKMKIVFFSIFLFLSGICIISETAQVMSVMVKETQVRAKPSYLGKILTVIKYGDKVTVLETGDGWRRIRTANGKTEGWVNESALTKKEIVMKAGEKDDDASSGKNVVLAGKGFNKDVEEKYKNEQKLDFSWIDRMEKIKISGAEMENFLSGGKLPGLEGGK